MWCFPYMTFDFGSILYNLKPKAYGTKTQALPAKSKSLELELRSS